MKIPIERTTDEITFVVMDEDPGRDDILGATAVKVSSLLVNNGVNDWFTITYKSKQAGSILLETRFEGIAG